MDLRTALTDALLDNASDAIVATDTDGVITFWNPGAARIFGFSAKEALGQSLDIVIPERLRARHWEGFRHTMATGESRYGHGDILSVPGLRKDGTQISVEFTIGVMTDNGRRVGLAAVMRDVSKRFEELRALRKQVAAMPKAST